MEIKLGKRESFKQFIKTDLKFINADIETIKKDLEKGNLLSAFHNMRALGETGSYLNKLYFHNFD